MQRELVWMKKDDPCGCSPVGNPLFSHGQLSLTIEKALDIAEENSPTPAPFAHEPGPVSGNADSPAGFP